MMHRNAALCGSAVSFLFLLSFLGGNPPVLYGHGDHAPRCSHAAAWPGGESAEPVVVAPVDPPTPVVKLRVRVPAEARPGAPVEYRIQVDNPSAADAHHVVVKNPMPKNAKFVRANPEPEMKEPELQWKLGTLQAGACKYIVLVLEPLDRTDLTNCVRVQFEHGQCVTTRLAGAAPVPQVKDKPPPPIIETEDKAQLFLNIEGPKRQYTNLATRYFVTVTNKSKTVANNVLLELTPAPQARFLQASDDGKFLAGKAAWLVGVLQAGESRTVVVTLQAEAAGELCHKAKALADRGVVALAEVCTLFAGVSALAVEMTDREDPIPVGGETMYPIKLRNTGTAPITNIQVRAHIRDGLQLRRAKAEVNHQLGEPIPGAQVLVFAALPQLAPGQLTEYQVYVAGAKPGDQRFRVEIRADQLEAGPVIEEESTRVYVENGEVAAKTPIISDR